MNIAQPVPENSSKLGVVTTYMRQEMICAETRRISPNGLFQR